MKVVNLMFDTLSRHMLPPYGNEDIVAPNFRRLAERTVTFDQCWAGSLPCMPARRDLHTGRYNFLHRSWGPLEPFDDSLPQILKNNGIYTHLATDHQHYWEDGGSTYHSRYNSYEFIRGQEGDFWKGEVAEPVYPDFIGGHEMKSLVRQDWINRRYIQNEEEFPSFLTVMKGLEFIDKNHKEDQWFLQIECFDPHEPFYVPSAYMNLYPNDYDGPLFDWPSYGDVKETPEQVAYCRLRYKALLSMCDAYVGKVLDKMDELHLWEDTMLIVNTDHGFLLGEHDGWGKCVQPFYNEVARIPLFIWDPRCNRAGVRSPCLVQNIDIAPTLLEYFGLQIPDSMQGHPLKRTISSDQPIRESLLFGIHGGHVNCTDGQYVYMRGPISPENTPLYNYTLMPTHIRSHFSVEELKDVELFDPFSFTKGLKTLRVNTFGKIGDRTMDYTRMQTMLFTIIEDSNQMHPIHDPEIERKMIQSMMSLMEKTDAPQEQYERLGFQFMKSVIPIGAKGERE
jgi:arylsulfatase A-like enzyme